MYTKLNHPRNHHAKNCSIRTIYLCERFDVIYQKIRLTTSIGTKLFEVVKQIFENRELKIERIREQKNMNGKKSQNFSTI